MSAGGEKVLCDLTNRLLELDSLIEEKEQQSRFGNDDDTENFINSMKNKNTESDLRTVTEFLHSLGEYRYLEDICSTELSHFLARCFLNVRKADTSEYEPTSLRSMQSSVARYLGNPSSLINTMWWNNTTYFGLRSRQEFGLRSRQEHIDMKWGDVQLLTTSDGGEYLQYHERNTKMRTGNGSCRPFPPKMFSLPGNPRCPVETYKVYRMQRPSAMLNQDAPFYPAVNLNYGKSADALWFCNQKMGKNKIGSIVKSMSENAGIQGRKVNHSAGKTRVTDLVHSGGISANQVMQVTGHKNIQSINHYSNVSIEQPKQMSNVSSELSSTARLSEIEHSNTLNESSFVEFYELSEIEQRNFVNEIDELENSAALGYNYNTANANAPIVL